MLIVYKTQNVNVPALATSSTALGNDPLRNGWQIQNQDTNPLYVCLGTGASATVYHMVLKAGGGAHDGTGGSFSQLNGVCYTGAVTVYSAGTPSYTVLTHSG